MVGNKTRIKVVKNKVAPPFKTAEVDIMYGEGISRQGEILDIGSEIDVVQKSGAWYSFNGDRLGQGRENAKQFLKENEAIQNEIYQQVRAYYQLNTETAAAKEDSDTEEQDSLV